MGFYCNIRDLYENGDILSFEKLKRKAACFFTGEYNRESSVTNMFSTNGWQVFFCKLNF